ncbi:MAG: pectinesterase family protein [Odoribacter sp.]|nr:pectinesterase family protein [Odoribacter sp.]
MKKIILSACLLICNLIVFAQVTKVITVAQDGSGDYQTIVEALFQLPENPDVWTEIYIKEGIYKEKLILDVNRNKVIIRGENPENTIISWNDHTGKVVNGDTINTYSSFTFSIRSDEVILQDITIENNAGRIGQAVALETRGDQIKIVNCRLLGDQDTFYTKGMVSRVYVKDSYIEGTTDYIFGPSIVAFKNCRIHSKSDSYITAASTTERNKYGYVFIDCTFTAEPTVKKLYLGRPWRSFAKTVLINCELPAVIRPQGWHNWNSTDKEKTVYYAEYNSRGAGANPEARVAWSHQLTAEEAVAYTLDKIFAKNTVSEPFKENWYVE